MENKKIKLLINEIPVEYDLLYTFESNITNKNYLVCEDNSLTDTGKLKTYAFIYYPDDKEKGVEPIKNQQDWEEVEKFLKIMGDEENE